MKHPKPPLPPVDGMLRRVADIAWASHGTSCIHEIACPPENTLFVAELLNWRVRKLSLHP